MTAVQTESAVGFPDPRPGIVEGGDGAWLLAGARCTACGYPTVEVLDRCPVCGGACLPAEFGPGATVFAATVLRVPVPGRRRPTPSPTSTSTTGRASSPTSTAPTWRSPLAPGSRSSVRLAEGDPLVRESPAEVRRDGVA